MAPGERGIHDHRLEPQALALLRLRKERNGSLSETRNSEVAGNALWIANGNLSVTLCLEALSRKEVLAFYKDAVDTVIGIEAALFPELVNHLDDEAIERPVEIDAVLHGAV